MVDYLLYVRFCHTMGTHGRLNFIAIRMGRIEAYVN